MKNLNKSAERESLGSRLGFILISAGCAIGIGNVWRFPYMVGQNGGGIFVLIYLVFLAMLGIPVMTMEFAMGRASRRSVARLYQEIEPRGSKWHIHSYFAIASNYILMMFYTSVTAWMIRYFIYTARGDLSGIGSIEEIKSVFDGMIADPWTMLAFVLGVVALGFLLCSLGLQKGIERVTKVMMCALLVLVVVLVVNSFTLSGAKEGLKFYLIPDFSSINSFADGFNVVVSAMNQAFFTLSVGGGSMAIFGSYINKERTLLGESVNIAALDTFIAFASGLIIFPACFSFGVNPDSGPNLLFVTLPNVFSSMQGGRIWGSLFFIFMTFAAFSTILAVFENIAACTAEQFGWSKKKSCLINAAVIALLSVPCVLGFNLLAGVDPFGNGSTIMDLEDFLVSNILLPLGSLVFVLFCTLRYGWGWNNFLKEANEGRGLKVAKWMRPYMTYVLPVLILIIFVVGLINFFGK